jgi:hypothetical protein
MALRRALRGRSGLHATRPASTETGLRGSRTRTRGRRSRGARCRECAAPRAPRAHECGDRAGPVFSLSGDSRSAARQRTSASIRSTRCFVASQQGRHPGRPGRHRFSNRDKVPGERVVCVGVIFPERAAVSKRRQPRGPSMSSDKTVLDLACLRRHVVVSLPASRNDRGVTPLWRAPFRRRPSLHVSQVATAILRGSRVVSTYA